MTKGVEYLMGCHDARNQLIAIHRLRELGNVTLEWQERCTLDDLVYRRIDGAPAYTELDVTEAAERVAHEEESKPFRALCRITGWQGPPRSTVVDAERDGREHTNDVFRAGGFTRIVIAKHVGDGCWTLDGFPIYPSSGRGCGAIRWSKP